MPRIQITQDSIDAGAVHQDGVLPDVANSADTWDVLGELVYGDEAVGGGALPDNQTAYFTIADDEGNVLFSLEGCLHWDKEFPAMFRIDHVLTQILELIVIVLNRLESTVTVQSNSVLLSNKIQQQYTSTISNINLLKASEAVDDFEDTEQLEQFKSDNETIQKRLEDLRNARTAERDAGKELTDAMKSTNDTLEQQSQLGSSIIQQLGELIRAIFR